MGNNKNLWTTGEDAILVRTMKEATNNPEGYRKASKLLNRTPSACMNRYAKERYQVVTETVEKNSPTVLKPQNTKVIADLHEEADELETYFTERIADLHEVKGLIQARHAYIYYRSYVWRITQLINKIK